MVLPPLRHDQLIMLVVQLMVYLCVALCVFAELFSLWEREEEECLHHLFCFSLPKNVRQGI